MDGEITIGTKLETKEFDKQIEDLENKLEDLENQKIYFEANEMTGDVKELEVEIEKTKNKLISLRQQKEKATKNNDVSKLKDTFQSMGDSIQNSIKKVSKLALGIFGIRSAYMALRRASSDLATYDEQYSINLEYIRYVLTQAIAPILEWIVTLTAKILGYINAIMQGWFGINLFSRGSAESFNKMKANANGVNKAVKEIKKQLAGFDEITMLTAQSDTGTSVGAGGVGITPSFDLSAIESDPPKWLKWIISHKKDILTILASIAAALITLKLGFNGLMALGVGVAIYGVIEAVKGLIAYIQNPTWENFKRFLGGLAVAITGVAVAMIAFNATNPVGWMLLAVGAVTALVTAIVGLTAKLVTNKAQILDTKKAQEELKKAQEELTGATDAYVNAVDRAEEAEKNLAEAEKKTGLSGKELYEQVKNGTLDYKNMSEAQREVYKTYLQNINAQEQLTKATQDLSEAKEVYIKKSWEEQLSVANETKNFEEFRDAVVKAYQDGELSAEEARDYIERAMADMSNSTRKTFTKDLPENISEGLNPSKYESVWTKFVNAWNEFWNKLKKKIGMDFEVTYSSGSGGGGGSSSGGRAKGGIFYPSKLPRLAVGGIINQPGRGLPYHGAIIGERGAEAVVPLTDLQQMELLGETIGKYITLNATIPISVGNRQIAREIRRINTEQDFAFNS